MNLYDIALARRRRWKEEGRQEALAIARSEWLREKIAAILDDPELTPEAKNRFIAILNSNNSAGQD